MITLTLAIITSIAVIVALCCILVGAASDPLSTFDSPYQRSRDSEAKRAVSDRIEWQGHTHIERSSK